ncbi:hypothetical protein SAMN05428959_10813 [Duganella sp. CF517]|uniref:DUF6651 domain-containing protein n=1 Tax=Duganella sp. CF517 TaxID=1881038 RepID=UPI0008B87E3D|nr:DUF6651 domain-containing protein [Duganella sp. CF517]SEO43720.1 hypothetical protein SAMN05428959_10813 [Duganella sp. CF517]
MKIKTTPDGKHAILKNGVPLYVMADGTEREIDGAAAFKLALSKHFEASPVMSRLKLPADIIAASFGSHFDIQGGKLVALDKHGIKEYSSSRPGEVATFDEALGQLIDRYPNKSMLLKDVGAPGAAQAPGEQPGKGGTVTRAAFDAMPPAARAKYITGGGRIADVASAAPPAPPSGSITRATFDTLNPQERAKYVTGGGKVAD